MFKPSFSACLAAFAMASVPFAQAHAEVKAFPPSMNLEIAGQTIWVSPKGDVWPRLDKAQQRFVQDYAAALYSKNEGQFKNLILPESLSCLEKAPKRFLEEQMKSLTSVDMVADVYSLAFEPLVQKFPPAFDKSQKLWFSDPLENTHTFGFGYVSPNGSKGVLTHKLLQNGDRYYIILSCPTEKNVERLQSEEIREKEYKEFVRKALAALTQKELDTLNGFLGQFAYDVAVREYQKMHPEYERYAMGVIDFLRKKIEDERKKEIATVSVKQKEIALKKAKEEPKVVKAEPEEFIPPPQNVTLDGNPSRWWQGGIIFALILAAGVLLLRVLKSKK